METNEIMLNEDILNEEEIVETEEEIEVAESHNGLKIGATVGVLALLGGIAWKASKPIKAKIKARKERRQKIDLMLNAYFGDYDVVEKVADKAEEVDAND